MTLGFVLSQEPPPLAALPEFEQAPAAMIELGRSLFFDPALSGTQTVSCATCHQPHLGWTDGRATPTSLGAPLVRNTPTVLNVAFNGLVTGTKPDVAHAPMFWDSRVESLEQQVFVPIRSHDEMRGDACAETQAVQLAVDRVRASEACRRRFKQVFGEAEVTSSHLAQAIAAFERSLVTRDTAFDKFMRGSTTALSDEQKQGMKLFNEAGCNQCHSGPMLSDYKLHFIGVRSELRAIRTPSLRNLRHTAPYMHDGSLRTVRDVLTFYEQLMDEVSETLDGGDKAAHPPLDPLLQKLSLKAEDFTMIEAFLNALSADHYDQTKPDGR